MSSLRTLIDKHVHQHNEKKHTLVVDLKKLLIPYDMTDSLIETVAN